PPPTCVPFLPLHDALPIWRRLGPPSPPATPGGRPHRASGPRTPSTSGRRTPSPAPARPTDRAGPHRPARGDDPLPDGARNVASRDRKSTRLNSSHQIISYA